MFSQVDVKLISLFQNSFPPAFDECVEFDCELRHAVAEVLESKVDAGQRVRH